MFWASSLNELHILWEAQSKFKASFLCMKIGLFIFSIFQKQILPARNIVRVELGAAPKGHKGTFLNMTYLLSIGHKGSRTLYLYFYKGPFTL